MFITGFTNGDEIAKAKGSELINNVTFPRIRQAVRNPVLLFLFCFFACLFVCLFVFCVFFPVYCLPNVVSVSGLSIFEFPSFYSNVSLVWLCYVVSLQDRLILLWVFYNHFLYISTNLPKSVCFTFYWNLVWCKWWLCCIYADSPTWIVIGETSLFALLRFRAKKDIVITTPCKSILTFKDIQPS